MPKLSPVTVSGIKVFEYQALLAFLATIGRREEFVGWFYGQTGLMEGEKLYIYATDVERFFGEGGR